MDYNLENVNKFFIPATAKTGGGVILQFHGAEFFAARDIGAFVNVII